MRLSTSNSDVCLVSRTQPAGRWVAPLVAGLFIFIIFVCSLELALSKKGFQATLVDSPAVWARERQRVQNLGSRGLIIIGASRAQLDIDLDVLQHDTGMVPVQLAIDGSTFPTILADLASDAKVTGTIVVDYADYAMGDLEGNAALRGYLSYWKDRQKESFDLNFNLFEDRLDGVRQQIFRSFADGAGPMNSLLFRALPARSTPQYLVTLPTRERRADYNAVPMPRFYFDRVARTAGLTDLPQTLSNLDEYRMLSSKINQLSKAYVPNFRENALRIGKMVRTIESRGGQVIFVMFPKSGLVRKAEDMRFPRTAFWDVFISEASAKGLNYQDDTDLNKFICPDGSHLDFRDQARFTRALVRAFADRGWIAAPR